MKWYWWIAIAVAVIVISFFAWKMFGKKSNGSTKTSTAENGGAGTGSAEAPPTRPAEETSENGEEAPMSVAV